MMTEAFDIVLGTREEDRFIRLAAGTEASLTVSVTLHEKAGTAAGDREFIVGEIGWQMGAAFRLTAGNAKSIAEGDELEWAMKIGDEYCVGRGAVTHVRWSGGTAGTGTLTVDIEGDGTLQIYGLTESDWILDSGYWDDLGYWRDGETWKDS